MKSILFLFMWLVIIVNTYGQSGYELSTFTENYSELVGVTSLNQGLAWDGDEFWDIPLGFEMDYLGKKIISIGIFDGALLWIDNGDINGLDLFGSFLADRGILTGSSQSPISYKTEGEIGSRIFKLEWKNVGFSDEISKNDESNDYANIQLWMYESDNIFEFRYGDSEINYPELSYNGSDGPVPYLEHNIDTNTYWAFDTTEYIVSGNPLSPELLYFTPQTDTVGLQIGLSSDIPEGTVYRFTPKITSVFEGGLEDFKIILYPTLTKNGRITVEFTSEQAANTWQFSIVNLQGQVLQQGSLAPYENQLTLHENLPIGNYIITFYGNNLLPVSKRITKL